MDLWHYRGRFDRDIGFKCHYTRKGKSALLWSSEQVSRNVRIKLGGIHVQNVTPLFIAKSNSYSIAWIVWCRYLNRDLTAADCGVYFGQLIKEQDILCLWTFLLLEIPISSSLFLFLKRSVLIPSAPPVISVHPFLETSPAPQVKLWFPYIDLISCEWVSDWFHPRLWADAF